MTIPTLPSLPHSTPSVSSMATGYESTRCMEAVDNLLNQNEHTQDVLEALVPTVTLFNDRHLLGKLPSTYPEIADLLQREKTQMESRWPV